MVDQGTVTRFATLFTGRVDAVGRLTRGGKGLQEKCAVTVTQYRAHLDGQRYPEDSLGIYPLLDDGMCWWVCGDSDLGDEAGAWRLADALERHEGVTAWVEVSKGKGHHVWVFFADATPAFAARRLMNRACADAGMPRWETFPKQDTTSAAVPFGNYVHLPYFGHPEAAGGRYFIGRDGRPLDLTAFLDRVTASTIPNWCLLAPPVRRHATERLERGIWDGRHPACVQALLDGGVGEGERNDALARLAAHLVNTEGNPNGEAMARQAALGWGLSEREAEQTIRSVTRSASLQYGCNRKREVGVMRAACNWEACSFHRSAGSDPNPPRFTITGDETTSSTSRALPVAALTPAAEPDLLELIAPSGFLRHYLDYVTSLSDAPPMAQLAAGIAIVSTTLGNRVFARGYSGSWLKPNLWIVFVAESGARKSSVMGRAVSFLRGYGPSDALLSDTASREQWIDEMAAQPSRLLRADEFVGLYELLQRDHMRGAKQFITELFAGEDVTYATKKDGPTVIRNPALSFLAACTPDELQRHVRREHFASGFLARMLFLPAMTEGAELDTLPQRNIAAEDAIGRRIEWMASLSGEVRYSDEQALRIHHWANAFRRQERGRAAEAIGLVNRAYDFAAKLATVLQVAETEPGARLWKDFDDAVLDRAMALTEWLIRVGIRFVTHDLAESDFERDVRRLVKIIDAENGAAPRWLVKRRLVMKPREFDDLINQAIETGEIVREERGAGTQGGRPATWYCRQGEPEVIAGFSRVIAGLLHAAD